LGAFHVHENSFQSLLFEYDTLTVTTMSFSTLLQSRWNGCHNTLWHFVGYSLNTIQNSLS